MIGRALNSVAWILLALTPAPALAQVKLLGDAGLGRQLRPLDARARALGGAAAALHGGNLSAVNPAALAQLNTPGLWATLLPEKRSVRGEAASGEVQTADVPLVRLGYPISRRWVASLGFGGYMDQDWVVEFTDTLSLSSGDVEFIERQNSDGGISQIRFELAGRVAERWDVGLALQLYSGESRRTVSRAFRDQPFAPYQSTAVIEFQGWGLTVGAEVQPISEILVGAAIGWSPALEVRNDSTGERLDVDLPITADVGASWQLTRDFVLALAFGWERWAGAADDLPGGARDAFRFGGGVELRALEGNSAQLMLRVGGRAERRPFPLRGGVPWERAFGFGLGASLARGLGQIDGTVEFGKRGDQDTNLLEESFTRFSFSVSVFAR